MKWTGIAAASGYAMGPAFLLHEAKVEVERRALDAAEIAGEIARFEEEVAQAIRELEGIREQVRKKVGDEEAEIFSAHILVLQDPEYIGAVKDKIKNELLNAEAALQDVTDSFVMLFESMDNEYMRERATDIRDVSGRVMQRLAGIEGQSLADFAEPVVLLAHDLTPSDTAQLDREKVAGFATNIGGRTSHSAIMARSMEIPAVVGLKEITSVIQQGDYIIVDGNEGVVYQNPDEATTSLYRDKQAKYEAYLAELKKLKDEPSITADGHHVEVVANIGNLHDAIGAKKNGAEGVGLYRTEFLYMGRIGLPSEEEQYEAYKAVAETFGARPVVIRTLDIGGDKELPYLDVPEEMNPFLGYRAIRLCLDQPGIFKTQLRAILRASVHGNVKLMYPMIATLTELRQANQLLTEVKQELDASGIPYNPKMEVGMMVEVPAAAMIADQLAKEVDFFSIGTNDLVQYTLAADRMNERVSYLAQPFHPAVLRLIRMVIRAAHSQGKWAGMCGEMAGNLTAIPLLLGLGLDEFSMSTSSVLPARALIHKLNRTALQSLAEQALELGTAEEIMAFVKRNVPEIAEIRG
ncbi:phosphoenolpyruvate--protein phosphotransferase [Aneurinibacillus thermoaerophilus]|uniref:Phosphoenolpyruvate-protein phosphotransferase n=1 Tax=Aneurinibacillus thermoaerophilus TaxID=143495 RepID=A0ABX8YFE7_ANETH|nr:phosphoenolpyruvate--protein phosphotransferase [Aneurinibacillus thermoaerophilus]MED0674996.1 phosphoenolpyruvate--protein phosphotransferase [Aneurinibacillus thermoaerophilus]MED0679603.1 phosphoenolpyruvate--protein phosphotransferase [Aneurinibacillus thermoaerophilus]MED0737399.1 phosphoenolpyruvate--protein phosphotransferase [Aneurinibacillus thermoaerophilus]MED0764971.1 phosphoenolpyruvate--protein phosphotransferase [Aneurinibacillus thermoaerophilus]QYY44493.1 phosphoenolpyruva